MKKVFFILLIAGATLYWGTGQRDVRTHLQAPTQTTPPVAQTQAQKTSAAQPQETRATHPSFDLSDNGRQVIGQGIVERILADDTEGKRHQRFTVRLASGQTILIAHNIDLAKRVSPLNTGDAILFNGQYEYTHEGGVVHWTHRDPRGKHKHGWLKRGSITYQ